jgi:hypothetical protein
MQDTCVSVMKSNGNEMIARDREIGQTKSAPRSRGEDPLPQITQIGADREKQKTCH